MSNTNTDEVLLDKLQEARAEVRYLEKELEFYTDGRYVNPAFVIDLQKDMEEASEKMNEELREGNVMTEVHVRLDTLGNKMIVSITGVVKRDD